MGEWDFRVEGEGCGAVRLLPSMELGLVRVGRLWGLD
jgi:hypothetical protein